MKKCPFCAEKIQDEAMKCRYCGEMISEKPGQKSAAGFWEYLGQKAKKNIDKFESNAENRNKQRQAVSDTLKQGAKKGLDKFRASAPNRKKWWQKIMKPPSFLDCLLGLLGLIIIVFCYFAFKIGFYLMLSKIIDALGL